MVLLALVFLIGGAFAIAVVASERHFGQPRRKQKRDQRPGNDDNA
jgi:hypothetical protein